MKLSWLMMNIIARAGQYVLLLLPLSLQGFLYAATLHAFRPFKLRNVEESTHDACIGQPK